MLFRQGIILLVLVTVLEPVFSQSSGGYSGKCVDDRGNPRKCVPEFENAAFEMPVEVTSTCGEQGPVEYCIQTGSLGLKRACDICDARDPRLRHPASALTDLTTNDNETWWQSETMYEGIQWPNRVNLTLRLRKSFDITYVRLKFHSPRPESFAIYKRVTEDGPWIPYQYYSATCRDFYGLPDQAYVYGGDETRALCTSEFSDISPLTGGNVAFSTLEGRPSAFHNFENSKELSEWVTATDIRVTLDRLNTFGDEVFGDEKVHRSYFYGISDLAVGGVCKCNGHASRCESQPVYGERGETNYVTSCVCEHNTAGRDCEQCLPFYNDVPWGRATSTNVHECKACNCNGFSNRCFFDVKLYEASGHGGHCLDCAGNRDGANCERCKPNFYQRSDGYCIPCYCNEVVNATTYREAGALPRRITPPSTDKQEDAAVLPELGPSSVHLLALSSKTVTKCLREPINATGSDLKESGSTTNHTDGVQENDKNADGDNNCTTHCTTSKIFQLKQGKIEMQCASNKSEITKVKISWRKDSNLTSGWSYSGRESDITAIVVYQRRLILCDRSTGILFQIDTLRSPAIRPIEMLLKPIPTALGFEPYPCSWMTVKGQKLLIGSTDADNEELKVLEYRNDWKTYVVTRANWTISRNKIERTLQRLYKGSRSLQCNSEGQCQCQPGVTGEKCDRCQANYYEFSVRGCKECSCSVAGSLGNEPSCTTDTGFCSCKENVEGQQCDKCKPGYFNIDVVNEFGCTPCFCYGHSAVCQSAPGYGQVILESIFSRSNERWTAEEQLGRQIPIQFNAVTENIGVTAAARESIYFLAPDRFLGDQRGSYNQELNFTLRIGEHGPKPSAEDIIIEGAGLRISRPIFGYRNTLPSIQNQDFTFRLHEHVEFGWNPRLSSRDFISILSNLTAIKIRATYTPKGVGFLDNVKLKTARRGAAGAPAPWIESCTCPDGYIGQYCESCAPGYTHEPKNGGPFARCVPCSCNGHASICDPESGQCICEHQTAGDNCERCARGYYGNSLKGTENDCNVCPCPLIGTSVGACIQLQDETTIVCLECPTGYAGPQCEFCGDGYFGDPTGQFGPRRDCQACDCNDNIDPNAVGNCNRTTGECIKCIYNTGGAKCDKCLPGFFGDALALPKGDCKNCECNGLGTIPTAEGKLICEEPTGKCPCKDNVIGRQCNACQDGYYDLASGTGCQLCMCDEVGSINVSCDVRSGHCNCREGVVGQRCNACAPNHYGFSLDGCKPCECDHIGSLGLQCDPQGQCPCRENVEGRACDRCKENKHNRQAGCVDCPACYNLIQDAATAQREKLDEMEKILDSIEKTQIVSNDQDFEVKLEQVQERVDRLWNNARSATGADESGFLDKVNELRDRVKALDQTSKQIGEALQQCSGNAAESTGNLTIAQDTVDRAQEALKNAQRFLDSDGKDALAKAQEKSNEYGQQSNMMSEMARQARALAEAHEKESAEIEKLGNAALNTSTTALDLLRGSMGQHSTITHEAKLLAQSTQQLEEEVKATKAKAQDALAKSKQAQDNALLLFKDAYAYNLPIVDLQTIKEQAQIAKTEAEKFKTDIEKLLEEKEGLLRESNEEVIQTKAMLENAIKHQQMADELMADLHSANSSAEEARKQSQDTFAEAQKIYDTLQDFNQKVESSKQAALEAKERIPEIQTLIAESESQTRQNQQALIGAKSAASYALKDAEKAKETAEKASKEATEIREECRVTKDQAGALRDAVEGLSRRVSDTLVRVAESEFLVGDDDTQVKTALEKASEAQSSSKSAYEKVQSALNTVRDIQLALDNLDAINEEGLEGLERKITQVESEFNSAGLDEKIAALREARNKQALWIKNYEDELEALRREVENVQEIRNSLPPDNKCWKRMRLEPV